jgi:hypothetical protein
MNQLTQLEATHNDTNPSRDAYIARRSVVPLGAGAVDPHGYPIHGIGRGRGIPFNGNGQFKFAIVGQTEPATYWSNDGTSVSGSEPWRCDDRRQ